MSTTAQGRRHRQSRCPQGTTPAVAPPAPAWSKLCVRYAPNLDAAIAVPRVCSRPSRVSQVGHYCVAGVKNECPENTYMANSSAVECLPCPGGSFFDGTGSTQCDPCEEGYFCPEGLGRIQCGGVDRCVPQGGVVPPDLPHELNTQPVAVAVLPQILPRIRCCPRARRRRKLVHWRYERLLEHWPAGVWWSRTVRPWHRGRVPRWVPLPRRPVPSCRHPGHPA